MDGILKDNGRNWLLEHFVERASRSDVPTTVVFTTEGGRAQAEDITMLTRKPVNVQENKYLLWSSICCFSGFFERLPLTKFRSGKENPYHIRAFEVYFRRDAYRR